MIPDESSYRLYGSPPYRTVLVHGGPGAAGYLAPLAGELSGITGIIDAYQTRDTIRELLRELHAIVSGQAEIPVTIIGHSWGAWLSMIFAAHHPGMAGKLILLSSAPFENRYVNGIMETRIGRMKQADRERFESLLAKIEKPDNTAHDAFAEIAGILRTADAYAPAAMNTGHIRFNYSQYISVWAEAERLRTSGELLEIAGKIRCPVLAIHGEHDPHPAEGVLVPLQGRIPNLRFRLLEKCGHEPWNEKYSRKEFFSLLEQELTIKPDAGS